MAKNGGAKSNDRGNMVGHAGKVVGKASDGGGHPVVPHAAEIPAAKASGGGGNNKGLPPGFKGKGVPPKVPGNATGAKPGKSLPPWLKGKK